jgi:hypothetical protein
MPTRHVASRRSALLVLALVVVVVGAVFALPSPAKVAPLVSSGLPASYQSAAAELRQTALPSTGVAPAIVVFSSTDGAPLTTADRGAVTARAAALAPLAVGGATPPPTYSADGTVAVVAVPVSTTDDAKVGETVTAIRATAVESLPDGLRAQVTGGPAYTADLTKVFEGADVTLLAATASVVAVLLLITYRSPWLWLVPLLVVGVAEQVTTKSVALLAPHFGIVVDPAAPSDSSRSRAVAPIPTACGRRWTALPMRPQTRPSRGPSPSRGTNGQNSPRPRTTIAAGSTTRPASIATTTPTAPENPMARRPSWSASSRVSSASVTVAADARIASAVRRSATCIAWNRLSRSRSWSR